MTTSRVEVRLHERASLLFLNIEKAVVPCSIRITDRIQIASGEGDGAVTFCNKEFSINLSNSHDI